MPIYEYYCAECQTKFDARRPMSKADAAIQCKNCESARTSRTLSMFAVGSGKSGSVSQSAPAGGFGGGGCCGGACGCNH